MRNIYKVVTNDPVGDDSDTWARIYGKFEMNFEVSKFNCAKGQEVVSIGLEKGGHAKQD